MIGSHRPTPREKHQAEALRNFQDAQASELLDTAQAMKEKTAEKLHTASLVLRRVAEGSI